MALEDNELYDSTTQADQIRLFPSEHGTVPKDLAAISGGATLPPGTPLAFNTSTNLWVPYDQGALNGTGVIGGILLEEAVVGASTETLAQVMILGVLHRDDVNTAAILALLSGAPSEAQLDTALKAGTVRQKGLIVEGLAGVL